MRGKARRATGEVVESAMRSGLANLCNGNRMRRGVTSGGSERPLQGLTARPRGSPAREAAARLGRWLRALEHLSKQQPHALA